MTCYNPKDQWQREISSSAEIMCGQICEQYQQNRSYICLHTLELCIPEIFTKNIDWQQKFQLFTKMEVILKQKYDLVSHCGSSLWLSSFYSMYIFHFPLNLGKHFKQYFECLFLLWFYSWRSIHKIQLLCLLSSYLQI